MNKIGWFLAATLITVLVASAFLTKDSRNFQPDFRHQSTQPYGSKAFVEWLTTQLHRSVTVSESRLDVLADTTEGAITLLIVDEVFAPDDSSAKAIDSLLYRGSTVLVAAANVSREFLRHYGAEVRFNYDDAFPLRDARDSGKQLTNNSYAPGFVHCIYDTEMVHPPYTMDVDSIVHDSTVDTSSDSSSRWLYIIQNSASPASVYAARTSVGNGTLIVCSAPQLFTNYAMLYDSLWNATGVLTSYLPGGAVVWDEHYKPRTTSQDQRTLLGYVDSHRGLLLAYVTLLGGLGLYLISSSRRRQRPIPTIEPPKNATLEHLSNITALYWLRRDNVAVAKQIIDQTRKHIVNRLRIPLRGDAHVIARHVSASSSTTIDVAHRLVEWCLSPLPDNVPDSVLNQLGQDATELFGNKT